MNFPVLDLHCDTALSLLREEGGVRRSLRRNTGHIDLARGSKIGGYAQCFACFTHPFDTRPHPMGWTPEMMFDKELAVLREQFSACSDLLRPARNAEELRRNREEGFISGVLTIEGTAGIGYDAGRLEELRSNLSGAEREMSEEQRRRFEAIKQRYVQAFSPAPEAKEASELGPKQSV